MQIKNWDLREIVKGGKIGEFKINSAALLAPFHETRPTLFFYRDDTLHFGPKSSLVVYAYAAATLFRAHYFAVSVRAPERLREFVDDPNSFERVKRLAREIGRRLDNLRIGDPHGFSYAPSRHMATSLAEWPPSNLMVGFSPNVGAVGMRVMANQVAAAARFITIDPVRDAVTDWDSIVFAEEFELPTIRVEPLGDAKAETVDLVAALHRRIDWVMIGNDTGWTSTPAVERRISIEIGRAHETGTPVYCPAHGVRMAPAIDHPALAEEPYRVGGIDSGSIVEVRIGGMPIGSEPSPGPRPWKCPKCQRWNDRSTPVCRSGFDTGFHCDGKRPTDDGSAVVLVTSGDRRVDWSGVDPSELLLLDPQAAADLAAGRPANVAGGVVVPMSGEEMDEVPAGDPAYPPVWKTPAERDAEARALVDGVAGMINDGRTFADDVVDAISPGGPEEWIEQGADAARRANVQAFPAAPSVADPALADSARERIDLAHRTEFENLVDDKSGELSNRESRGADTTAPSDASPPADSGAV